MRLIAYYAHPERGRKHEREDAARILNEFQLYYVTKVDVGQSYTKVWLYGFGQEIAHGFNSVFFDFYCEETKRCVDVPYELERPTVLGLFDVSELSVRRSEDTERTAASRNDTGKLHGNGYRAEGIVVDSTMSQERVNHESTNDLISRADAIDAVKKECWECCNTINDDISIALYALPSADRPRGEWQHKPSKSGEWIWWQCSECGAVIYSETEVDRKIHHAYCGVCGAYMKGGNE